MKSDSDLYRQGVQDALALVDAHALSWSNMEGNLRACRHYDSALICGQSVKTLELLAADIRAVLT